VRNGVSARIVGCEYVELESQHGVLLLAGKARNVGVE
jgi:hypothetical protein